MTGGDQRILALPFAGDTVLLAHSCQDLQHGSSEQSAKDEDLLLHCSQPEKGGLSPLVWRRVPAQSGGGISAAAVMHCAINVAASVIYIAF